MDARLLAFAVILPCFCEGPLASADTRSFKVQFAGYTEFVGWGPVSLAAAQPLVPAGYVIAGVANVAASGVPGRTLIQHFRDFKGTSPMRYLRNARYERVREPLSRA